MTYLRDIPLETTRARPAPHKEALCSDETGKALGLKLVSGWPELQ